MRNLLAAAALAAAGLPGTALAKEMSYAFIQLTGILDAEATLSNVPPPFAFLNGTKLDGDGLGIKAGWIYGPYAFSELRFENYDFDSGVEFDESSLSLGVRSRLPLRAPLLLDAYGAIAVESIKFQDDSGETGPGLRAGLRFSPIKYLELSAEYSYADLDVDNAKFWSAGIQWNVGDNFALNLGYRTGEFDSDVGTVDVDSLRLGARLQWGGG